MSVYETSITNPKKQLEFYKDLSKQLEQENQELKKQLEEMDSKLFFTENELEMRQKSIDNKLRQQKEFIEWLEANLEGFKLCDKNFFLTNYKKEIKSYEVILQKYKEIIGVKDEKINC